MLVVPVMLWVVLTVVLISVLLIVDIVAVNLLLVTIVVILFVVGHKLANKASIVVSKYCLNDNSLRKCR